MGQTRLTCLYDNRKCGVLSGMNKKINCVFCGESFYTDEYIEHLETVYTYHSYQLKC